MFSINWNFLTSKQELASAEIEELGQRRLYDEGYPFLKDGVSDFIQRYLAADEAVLVLQGLPDWENALSKSDFRRDFSPKGFYRSRFVYRRYEGVGKR